MANSTQKRGEPVRLPSLGYLSFFTGRRLGLEFVFGTCLLIVAVFVLVKDYAGDARRPAIAPPPSWNRCCYHFYPKQNFSKYTGHHFY